jgi:hypothetical protein
MILPRQSPPVIRGNLPATPAARLGNFATGRSFGCCNRLEWTPAGLQCDGRIVYGTVYEIARLRR